MEVSALIDAFFAVSSPSFSSSLSLYFHDGVAKGLWMGSGPKAVGRVGHKELVGMFKKASAPENAPVALLHRVVGTSIVSEVLTSTQLQKRFGHDDALAAVAHTYVVQKFFPDGRLLRVTLQGSGETSVIADVEFDEDGRVVDGKPVDSTVDHHSATALAVACASSVAGGEKKWTEAVVDIIKEGDSLHVLVPRTCVLAANTTASTPVKGGGTPRKRPSLPRINSARRSRAEDGSQKVSSSRPGTAEGQKKGNGDENLPRVTPRSARVTGGGDSSRSQRGEGTPKASARKESASSAHFPSVSPRASVVSSDSKVASPKQAENASTVQSSIAQSGVQSVAQSVSETPRGDKQVEKKEESGAARKQDVADHAEKLRRKLGSLHRAILTTPVLGEPEEVVERPRLPFSEEDPLEQVLGYEGEAGRGAERLLLREGETRGSDGNEVVEELGRSDEDHREGGHLARAPQGEKLGRESSLIEVEMGEQGKEKAEVEEKKEERRKARIVTDEVFGMELVDGVGAAAVEDIQREVVKDASILLSSLSAFRSGNDVSRFTFTQAVVDAEGGEPSSEQRAGVVGAAVMMDAEKSGVSQGTESVPSLLAVEGDVTGTAEADGEQWKIEGLTESVVVVEEALVGPPAPSLRQARATTSEEGAKQSPSVLEEEEARVYKDRLSRRAEKVRMGRGGQGQDSGRSASGRSTSSQDMGLRADAHQRVAARPVTEVPPVGASLLHAVACNVDDVAPGEDSATKAYVKVVKRRDKDGFVVVNLLRSLIDSKPPAFEGTTVLKKARPTEAEQGGLLKIAVSRGMGKKIAKSETRAGIVKGVPSTTKDIVAQQDEEEKDDKVGELRADSDKRSGEEALEEAGELYTFVSGLGLKTTRIAEIVQAEFTDVDPFEVRQRVKILLSRPTTEEDNVQVSAAVTGMESIAADERVSVEDESAAWIQDETQLDRLSAEASRAEKEAGEDGKEVKKAKRIEAEELSRTRDILAALDDVGLRHKTDATEYRLGTGEEAVLEAFLAVGQDINEGSDEPRLRLLEELEERLLVDRRAPPAPAATEKNKQGKGGEKKGVSSTAGGVSAGAFKGALQRGFSAGVDARSLEVAAFELGVAIRLQKKKGEESDKVREAAAPKVIGIADEEEEEVDTEENPLVELHATKAAYDVREEIEVMKKMNDGDKGDMVSFADDSRPVTGATEESGVAMYDVKGGQETVDTPPMTAISSAAAQKQTTGGGKRRVSKGKAGSQQATRERLAQLEKAKALALSKGKGRADIVSRIQAIEGALQQLYSKLGEEEAEGEEEGEEEEAAVEAQTEVLKPAKPASHEVNGYRDEDEESTPVVLKKDRQQEGDRRGSIEPHAAPHRPAPQRQQRREPRGEFADDPNAFERDMQGVKYEDLAAKVGAPNGASDPPPAAFNERLLALEKRRQRQREMEEGAKRMERNREMEEVEYGRMQAEAMQQAPPPRSAAAAATPPYKPSSAWGGETNGTDVIEEEDEELQRIEREEQALLQRKRELEARAANARGPPPRAARGMSSVEERMMQLHSSQGAEADPFDAAYDDTVGATPRVGASMKERESAAERARNVTASPPQQRGPRRQRNVVDSGSLRKPSQQPPLASTVPRKMPERPMAMTPEYGGGRGFAKEVENLSQTVPARPRQSQRGGGRRGPAAYGEVEEGDITASDFDTDDEGLTPSPGGGKLPLPKLDVDSVPLELRLDEGMVSPDTSMGSVVSRQSGFSKESRRDDDGDSTARSDYSDVDSVSGITSEFRSVFSKVRHGKKSDVVDMIERGCPVDTRDKHGNSLLIISCQNGHKRVVKALLRRGANLNCQNHRGQTALHFCYAYGYQELGDYLVSKGADDSIINNYGLSCYEGLQP